MGNRGQKRADKIKELPADKRACNSLEFKPSSSNSSVHTPMSSAEEAHDGDMETSSSTSGSTPSDGEGERDSAYGSCDSDNSYRDYYWRQSSGDQSKFRKVLSSLSDETQESRQLAALTELCELLSFCTDSSLSSLMADSFSPILVKLTRHESNPDIMLLAIRAMTYLCDIHPRSSSYLVRQDAVPALCQSLMAIEYLDVAEQCLQALEKISLEQPLACLQSGAIMAVLNYIDFFSTSVQRVALSVVVNICKKLPSECPSPFMEAVPVLCNLLQYEDRQLVESVATCLIRIVDRVHHSSDLLDELCKQGLVQQALQALDVNGRATLCQPVYTGLIGLLVKMASGSVGAVRTLFELNIGSKVKDILSMHYLSHGMPSSLKVDGQYNQVLEALKLLNELLPAVARELPVQQVSDMEAFVIDRSDLLHKFGLDMLDVLVQVVNSGVNLHVCYGCLSVINKLVHFSKSDKLLPLLQSTNISSFLAGVFTRKDHHVLILALQIVNAVLQKLPNEFLNSFVKEGVLFAVDAILSPEKCSQFMFPVINSADLPNDASRRLISRDSSRCLCFAFENAQHATSSGPAVCKLERETLQNLAKLVKTNYFASQLLNPEKGLTDVLQKLKTLSSGLTGRVNQSLSDPFSSHHEEEFYPLLHQILLEVVREDPISTFEFIESGVIRSIVYYLSNGQYMTRKGEINGIDDLWKIIEKRFEVLGRLFLSFSDPALGDFPLLALVRRLQSALSSVENYPVILSHVSRLRNSYAMVPYAHSTSYPCLKVKFMKGEGETCLHDYSEDVMNVDPFAPLGTIEEYLWSKVGISGSSSRNVGLPTRAVVGKDTTYAHSLSNSSPSQGQCPGFVVSDSTSINMHEMQEEKAPLSASVERVNSKKTVIDATDLVDYHPDPVEPDRHCPSEEDGGSIVQCPGCNSDEDAPLKLLLYLESHRLDPTLSLYQSILQHLVESENDIITDTKLWNQVYRITYRQVMKDTRTCAKICHHQIHHASRSEQVMSSLQYNPSFASMFVSEFVDLEKSSAAYDILSLMRSLESINRLRFHLMSRERVNAFAEGKCEDLDNLKVAVSCLPQTEFVNSKLTEKLEQQMRDPLAVSICGMPSWCTQLVSFCPFLFSFEARCKYFRLAALGQQPVKPHQSSHTNGAGWNVRLQNSGSFSRKKFLVHRDRILDSASQMMDMYARSEVVLEVEYNEEVGSGLGPTLEFYTLVSQEFQKVGLGLWREDRTSLVGIKSLEAECSGILQSSLGLFPRPWSPTANSSSGIEFSEILKKFFLLGQIVAKALQDSRVMDFPFSKAFYKIILGKELTIYDIQSFDPELGKILLEFQALVERKRYLESVHEGKQTCNPDICFRSITFEDLCLDFVLPGYPDYALASALDLKMVNLLNLEEYVSLIVDATIKTGIFRQVEAFKSGFDQVFPIRHLEVFCEEELERLLCGEGEIWNSTDVLDHIKFDHGYTASSPPVLHLLEIIREFDNQQQKAFLQFVTGATRLPPGGLASLNPKFTIVRKHCSKSMDNDLPSVMTCANYLKLPPYASKEKMKEKLLYAITEGQGSFYLS